METNLLLSQVTCIHLWDESEYDSDSDSGHVLDGWRRWGDQTGSCDNLGDQMCQWEKLHKLDQAGKCGGRSKWLSKVEGCVGSVEPASLLHSSCPLCTHTCSNSCHMIYLSLKKRKKKTASIYECIKCECGRLI